MFSTIEYTYDLLFLYQHIRTFYIQSCHITTDKLQTSATAWHQCFAHLNASTLKPYNYNSIVNVYEFNVMMWFIL